MCILLAQRLGLLGLTYYFKLFNLHFLEVNVIEEIDISVPSNSKNMILAFLAKTQNFNKYYIKFL